MKVLLGIVFELRGVYPPFAKIRVAQSCTGAGAEVPNATQGYQKGVAMAGFEPGLRIVRTPPWSRPVSRSTGLPALKSLDVISIVDISILDITLPANHAIVRSNGRMPGQFQPDGGENGDIGTYAAGCGNFRSKPYF